MWFELVAGDRQSVPDSAFSATSSVNSRYGPSSARMDPTSSLSWMADVDKNHSTSHQ